METAISDTKSDRSASLNSRKAGSGSLSKTRRILTPHPINISDVDLVGPGSERGRNSRGKSEKKDSGDGGVRHLDTADIAVYKVSITSKGPM